MLTTRLVDFDSSHTTGRARMAIRSRIGAASSERRSARWSASRLGASSPSTRVTNVIPIVTIPNDSGDASDGDMPSLMNAALSRPASVAEPYTPETRVASVTPICTDDRKRFGS